MKVVSLCTLCLIGSSSAFLVPSKPKDSSGLSAIDRRHFVEMGSAALLVGVTPALALEDLAEPTPEEKEAAEVCV